MLLSLERAGDDSVLGREPGGGCWECWGRGGCGLERLGGAAGSDNARFVGVGGMTEVETETLGVMSDFEWGPSVVRGVDSEDTVDDREGREVVAFSG